jgi:hypothetical protein
MTGLRPASLLLLLASLPAVAAAAMLIDSDFGGADRGVVGRDGNPNARVTGVVPEGWADDSGWAEVWAECRIVKEEGRRFLRINVTKKDTGRLQLTLDPLPDVQGETYFRLTFRLRNFTGAPMEIGLRMSGEPWEMYWSVKSAFTREWRDYRYDFRLDGNDQQMGLWLNVFGVGEVDIARLRLERLSKEALVAELKAKHPDGGPANLIRNSRLPLGLQNGWALDRDCSDGDDVKVGPDRDVIGPSGAPALRIEPEGHVKLRVEPFGVVCPVVKHSAVMQVRGEGEWRFVVNAEGHDLGSETLKLAGDEWRRAEVQFTPSLMAKVYEWRLEGSGDIWIDSLQVGPADKVGRKASDFSPAGECEVALACHEGDASAARVLFDDEPARVRYCVVGKVRGSRLKVRVVNLYGDVKELPSKRLGLRSLTYGTLRFDVFPRRPCGGFRVEAWVEKGGRRISPCNELVVYRLRRPRYWMKDAPGSPFGTHTNSTTRHILMAKAIGVNWTRFHDAGLQYIGWWNLEPERGQWRFFDKEIHRFRKYGMKIFAELGTAPKWASYWPDSGRKQFGYFDKFFQPKNLDEYANYVRTVATRYKGVIDAWDVWNEPWIHAWWGVDHDETKGDRDGFITSEHPMRDFANLMKTAFETAKSVDPDATVAGFNTTDGPGWKGTFSGTEWTRGVLASGGLDFCDVLDYHQYTGEMAAFPGDVAELGYKRAWGPVIEKLGRAPKPVWLTEGQGAVEMSSSGFYNHTLPYEDSEDFVATANLLCRHVVGVLAQGVEKVFLYTMHNHGPFSPKPGSWTVFVTH